MPKIRTYILGEKTYTYHAKIGAYLRRGVSGGVSSGVWAKYPCGVSSGVSTGVSSGVTTSVSSGVRWAEVGYLGGREELGREDEPPRPPPPPQPVELIY